MRDTNEQVSNFNVAQATKPTILNLPKIRFYHSKEPKSRNVTRVTRHKTSIKGFSHDTQSIAAENFPNLNARHDKSDLNKNLNGKEKENRKRELVPLNTIHLCYPTTLRHPGSTCSPQRKLRPRSVKNFWSTRPDSLETQTMVLSKDIDALSIEIVRLYNEPIIALPKLDMGPAGM